MAAYGDTATVAGAAYMAWELVEELDSMQPTHCPTAVPARCSSPLLLPQAAPLVMAVDRTEARDMCYFAQPELCP